MLVVLVVALSGCASGISVQSDWDPEADFSAFNTFAVLDEATGGGGLDQLMQNRVKTSIANTLTAKGKKRLAHDVEQWRAVEQAMRGLGVLKPAVGGATG